MQPNMEMAFFSLKKGGRENESNDSVILSAECHAGSVMSQPESLIVPDDKYNCPEPLDV